MNKKNDRSKIVAFTVILTWLFSAVAGLTPSATSGEGATSDAFTHTVLAEYGGVTY